MDSTRVRRRLTRENVLMVTAKRSRRNDKRKGDGWADLPARPRVLGAGRLSRAREESTSEPRQKETVSGVAQMLHGELVDWKFDSNVSGRDVSPFARPELSPWFKEPLVHDWDVLSAWKMDRLTRRALHFHELMEWMKEHGKHIVTSDVNTTTKAGRQTAELMAMVASWEWEAIQERAQDSYDELSQQGRFPGGSVPYGYLAVKQASGEGWRLTPDDTGVPGKMEPTAAIARDLVRRAIEGAGNPAIAAHLNKTGHPTSTDADRIRRGKEPKGVQWHPNSVRAVLRS